MGISISGKVAILAAILACTSACLGNYALASQGSGIIWRILAGLVGFVCCTITLICVDIIYLKPATSHTFGTLLGQYLMVRILSAIGTIFYYKFLKATKDLQACQEQTLLKYITKNENTAYGKDHHFNNIKNRDDFVKSHPLTNFNHYQNYVDRAVYDGEENVMTPNAICYCAESSGTTGKPKIMSFPTDYRSGLAPGILAFLSMRQSIDTSLGRYAAVRLPSEKRQTERGIEIGIISRLLAPHQAYGVTPIEVDRVEFESDALYIEAVFAAAERDVRTLDGFAAPLCFNFFKIMEQHVDQICNDIRYGQLGTHLNISPELRRILNAKLKPDPPRSAEVSAAFKDGVTGVAKRLWPNVNRVVCLSTGSLAHYGKLLTQSYIKGLYPLSSLHIATEGMIGMRLSTENENNTFVLVANVTFFEFIPEEEAKEENPETLFIEQLELGRCYEVVVTNHYGLYRYRMGDIIKIVDFFNGIPVFEFQYRVGTLLNLLHEKTSEDMFYKAIEATESSWNNCCLVDYTAVENFILDDIRKPVVQNGKHYVVFVEVTHKSDTGKNNEQDKLLTEQEKNKLDKELCNVYSVYKSLRDKGEIDPIEMIQVGQGTFARLKDVMHDGRINQQFKMPRALRNQKGLRHLLSNVLIDRTQ